MDISKLTVEALKAAAYDQLAIRENASNNLALINTEIAKRVKEEKPVEIEK